MPKLKWPAPDEQLDNVSWVEYIRTSSDIPPWMRCHECGDATTGMPEVDGDNWRVLCDRCHDADVPWRS